MRDSLLVTTKTSIEEGRKMRGPQDQSTAERGLSSFGPFQCLFLSCQGLSCSPGGLLPLLWGSTAPGRRAPLRVPARRFLPALYAPQGPSLTQIGKHSPAHLSYAPQYSSGSQAVSGRTRCCRDYQLRSPGWGRHLALCAVSSRSARTARVRGTECTFSPRSWFGGLFPPQSMWQRGLDSVWKSGCIGWGITGGSLRGEFFHHRRLATPP
ncbi:hypothetical protein NDU88_003998 [Pleurodeles waltl]|uniref:Uncharacterized protein n=1 Tax=Pleurodeles waltl TaxID=8319 RepID=A0AAV7LH21_PLEWA|nr:hypothetical protein NDU88_003998 [Pleurodeles waltl]